MVKAAAKNGAKLPDLGMVGRCFVIWGDDGHWQFQGIVRGEPQPGVYLCQFFDALMGGLSTLTVFPLDRMISRERLPGAFTLFEDDEHLRDWCETWGKRR